MPLKKGIVFLWIGLSGYLNIRGIYFFTKNPNKSCIILCNKCNFYEGVQRGLFLAPFQNYFGTYSDGVCDRLLFLLG